MDTVVLSDLIGVSDPGRAIIRSWTNSKPAPSPPSTSEFAANLHPPKLNYETSKFLNLNPKTTPGLKNDLVFKDANTKVKEFKNRLKLSKSQAGAEDVKSTGLFSFEDLTLSKDDEMAKSKDNSSKISVTLVRRNSSIMFKPKPNVASIPPQPLKSMKSILRTPKKFDVDVDMRHRINKAFESIESLGKDFEGFDKSLKDATERAVADGKSSKKLFPNSLKVDAVPGLVLKEKSSKGSKKPLGVYDVTRPPNKMFGFDATKVLESSGASAEESDEGKNQSNDPAISGNFKIPKEAENNGSGSITADEDYYPTNPQIPTIRDTRFLARHERQGSILKSDMDRIKSQLEVMGKKSDREASKAVVRRKKTLYSRPSSNINRIMAFNPVKGPGRELTDFLQSNGGLYGGWDADDHNSFVAIYRKWKERPAKVIALVNKDLPDKKVEEIAEHIVWYEKYQTLNEANKAYIRQWQTNQRREKELMFRMTKQDQITKLEEGRRKQTALKAIREDEREKNRSRLDEYKSSIEIEKKMNRVKADLIRGNDNEARVGKLQEAMENLKKGFSYIQPKHPDVKKYLATKKNVPIAIAPAKKSGVLMRSPSSGIFSGNESDRKSEASGGYTEYVLDLTEEQLEKGPLASKKGSKIRRKPDSKGIRQNYQKRDATMVEARREAIRVKLENKRNKTLLSTEEIKDRVKNIKTPSKVLSQTEGWKNRKLAIEAHKLEISRRQLKSSLEAQQHNESRLPADKLFQTGMSIRLIPKLGAPSWKRTQINFN